MFFFGFFLLIFCVYPAKVPSTSAFGDLAPQGTIEFKSGKSLQP